MVRISKDEKEKILSVYPNAHIVRLMKRDSKRHHYWMTEEKELMDLLEYIRNGLIPGVAIPAEAYELTNKNIRELWVWNFEHYVDEVVKGITPFNVNESMSLA